MLKCFQRLYFEEKKSFIRLLLEKNNFCHLSFLFSHHFNIFTFQKTCEQATTSVCEKNLHKISDIALVAAVPRRSFVLDFKIGSLCCHPLTEHSLPWATSLYPTLTILNVFKCFLHKKTLLFGDLPEVVRWYSSITLFVIRTQLLPATHSEVHVRHLTTIPWGCSFIFGTVFYRLWMPLPTRPVWNP